MKPRSALMFRGSCYLAAILGVWAWTGLWNLSYLTDEIFWHDYVRYIEKNLRPVMEEEIPAAHYEDAVYWGEAIRDHYWCHVHMNSLFYYADDINRSREEILDCLAFRWQTQLATALSMRTGKDFGLDWNTWKTYFAATAQDRARRSNEIKK